MRPVAYTDAYHEPYRMGRRSGLHGWSAKRKSFRFPLRVTTVNLYRNDMISVIFVSFLKQVVGYFVFQTEGLDRLAFRKTFRLVANEQMLKVTAAIHNFSVFLL